jgi:transcriptional regulator with XRE-family HTH domain
VGTATENERRHASPSDFGRWLRCLRSSADLTQDELAERAGVSARLISDLERGTIQRPRRDTVRMLADGLRLTGVDREKFTVTARQRTHEHTPDYPPPGRTGLPLPPTPLVGRDRELTETIALLLQPETRLLTLTGPGGVGKTRLALEVAQRVINAYPDAVRFVDLAPVAVPALVLPAIAECGRSKRA